MCLSEINNNLKEIAIQKTNSFCYSCYEKVSQKNCPKCGSDEFMRLLPGYGVEYGTDWVIKILLEENISSIDLDETFKQMIDDCYSEETQIGFIKVNTAQAIKSLDPIAWDIAVGEYFDGLEQDEEVISFDGGANYYWKNDIESYIGENLVDSVDS